ncbi:MAG: NAD(P)H-dependent oxidoreductase [Coriobacteriia bacterium]|nr:NAD(P)H-dependent oxidoreductase [Coriobacteriia bacterium]
MKNLVIINGSPRKGGNSDLLAYHLKTGLMDVLDSQGSQLQVQTFSPVTHTIHSCKGCQRCATTGECVQKSDDLYALVDALAAADALLWVSPLYFGAVSAQQKAVIDRMQLLWARNVRAGHSNGLPQQRTRPALAYFVAAHDDPFATAERRAAALLSLTFASNTAGFQLAGHYALTGLEKAGDIFEPAFAEQLAQALSFAAEKFTKKR